MGLFLFPVSFYYSGWTMQLKELPFRCSHICPHWVVRQRGVLQEGDEISMTDMAQLIAVDSEEDDEDEEDDPDYEPLSMEEDSIQAQEMVSRCSTASRCANASCIHHAKAEEDVPRLCD